MAKKNNIKSKDLLKKLAMLNGPSGFESEVIEYVLSIFKDIGEVKKDKLGSVLVEKKGESDKPRIMLAAHADEIGFMVRGITEGGLLKFTTLGSWWSHTLLAHRVKILTQKGEIEGVIASVPPHHLSAADKEKLLPIKNMVIDVGATNAAQVADIGIAVGDPIVPYAEWFEMANKDLVCCKAFDDRVGLAVLIQVLLRIDSHPNTIIGAATVQEEVGLRGAKTAVNVAQPDFAIILEAPPADDFPGCTEFVQCALGKGPQIRAYDPTMITSSKLFKVAKETAQELKIPYQVAVRETGGTDAGSIHLHHVGVPSIVIGVPVRYAHSHYGIVSMQDLEKTVELVIALIKKINKTW